ncbi:MAG: SDR family NAD(P)-dependent oxidoreductase [Pseudomonadota bacterium]
MTHFLITGGAGFIGSHIAEQIVRKGLGKVTVFDNLSSGHEENIAHLKDEVRFIKGDVRHPDDIKKAIEGIDIVFHDAAFASAFDSYNEPGLTNDINIGGTYNLLEAAHAAGVKRMVLASSAAIYGTESELPNSEDMLPRPQSPYAISKLCNEYYARMFALHKGLETVCLRYFNVFGPRQDPSSEYSGVISRFIEQIRRGENLVVYGDGTQTRDFIYVGDVARANILASQSEKCGSGECINIGTGKETNLLELIDALKKACERDVMPEFKPSRTGDIKRSVAAVKLARDLTDFFAQTDFDDGIKQLIAHLPWR